MTLHGDTMVREICAAAYEIPTEAPEADGTAAWASTTMVLAQVRAGDVLGTGWTYGAAAAAALIRDQLASCLLGRDVLDVPAAYQAMVRSVRNAGRPGIAAGAVSALDVALWDAKARLLGVRLARLLGQARDAVPVYGSGGFTTYTGEQEARQLGGWVHEQGIPRVKIKIAESWGTRVERDLARIVEARQVIGPQTELYVDANGGYTAKQAIRVAREAEACAVRWLEEPVSSDDLAGLRRVRDAVRCDVAAGEYGYDLPYFARMLSAGAVDCLQADMSRCGGISEWLRVAALAAAHGLELSGHCAPLLHLDAAAATPNLRHLEWFHDHARIETMLFDGAAAPEPGGVLQPDLSRSGHGLHLRTEVAQRYQVA